jgi:hypothetical protein
MRDNRCQSTIRSDQDAHIICPGYKSDTTLSCQKHEQELNKARLNEKKIEKKNQLSNFFS